MRALNTLFIAILLIGFSFGKKSLLQGQKFDRNYWLGSWTCTGYTCGQTSIAKEKITIAYVGDEFVATKSDAGGDKCVRDGKKSIWGKKSAGDYDTDTPYPVSFQIGRPDAPENAVSKYVCNINGENEFDCLGINCKRTTPYQKYVPPAPAPAPKPAPVPAPAPKPAPVPAPAPKPAPVPAPAPKPAPVPVPAPAPRPAPVPAPIQIQPFYYILPPTVIQVFQPVYFFFRWNLDGYVCNGKVAPLVVQFSTDGKGGFQGIVTVGNACIKNGIKLIYGTLPTQLINTKPITVYVYVIGGQYQIYPLYMLGLNTFMIPQLNWNFGKAC